MHTRYARLLRPTRSIEVAYRELGHTLGWRFPTGPAPTLSVGTEIAFITLNPGGASESADHPRASCEAGNAEPVRWWEGVRGSHRRGREALSAVAGYDRLADLRWPNHELIFDHDPPAILAGGERQTTDARTGMREQE